MLLEKDGSNALIGDNLGNGTPHHGLRGGKSCMASSIGNLEEECRIWLNHNKPWLDFFDEKISENELMARSKRSRNWRTKVRELVEIPAWQYIVVNEHNSLVLHERTSAQQTCILETHIMLPLQ